MPQNANYADIMRYLTNMLAADIAGDVGPSHSLHLEYAQYLSTNQVDKQDVPIPQSKLTIPVFHNVPCTLGERQQSWVSPQVIVNGIANSSFAGLDYAIFPASMFGHIIGYVPVFYGQRSSEDRYRLKVSRYVFYTLFH